VVCDESDPGAVLTNTAHGRLSGKVAIITGATSGIGAVAARRFGAAGAKVIVAGRNEAAGRRIAKDIVDSGGVGAFVKVDVRDLDDVERLVEAAVYRFGELSVVYSNAGLHQWGSALDTSADAWHDILETNLTGQFYVATAGARALTRFGGGSVILTSSDYGVVGARNSVAYCAAKGGVLNLTRALAVDLGAHSIRVNCLVPGPTTAGRTQEAFAADSALEALETRASLLGRLGTADEVAAAAVFLASDESSFVTGSIYVVDGGVTAWYGV
jgi:meso-butanediol dehydrogenase / (S,S)-butanediol dehydrogenase / diacetyl reductase